MELCDICALPKPGSRVSTVDVHKAVNHGFDPLRLDLLPVVPGAADAHAKAREAWDLAMRSETDWEICDDCLQELGPYLPFATRSRLGLIPGENSKHGPKDLMHLVEQKMRERGFASEHAEPVDIDLKTSEVRKAEGDKKACFIATAACGPNAPEVEVLRSFRDAVLVDSWAGRAFIRGYWRVGPRLACWIEPRQIARGLVRSLVVLPVAWLVERLRK